MLRPLNSGAAPSDGLSNDHKREGNTPMMEKFDAAPCLTPPEIDDNIIASGEVACETVGVVRRV